MCVLFEFIDSKGVMFIKIYIFKKGNYVVGLEYIVNNVIVDLI